MPRYRLTTRAQMHGAVREPGYVFDLPEGDLGPHRTVIASDHGAQIADHIGASAGLVDVPLYEEIKEERPLVEPQGDEEVTGHVTQRREPQVLFEAGRAEGAPAALPEDERD